jgi:hypothetical protein
MMVVVPDAGGAPEVGIGCPGGGRMTLVVDSTLLRAEETADSAGGAYDGLPGCGTHSVTVTVAVTVAAGAQAARRLINLCDAKCIEQ